MILNKIIIGLCFILFLNGCVQGTVLLGPVFTLLTNGSVTQAGLSYSSEKAIKKATGKSSTENIKILIEKNKAKKAEDHDQIEFMK